MFKNYSYTLGKGNGKGKKTVVTLPLEDYAALSNRNAFLVSTFIKIYYPKSFIFFHFSKQYLKKNLIIINLQSIPKASVIHNSNNRFTLNISSEFYYIYLFTYFCLFV